MKSQVIKSIFITLSLALVLTCYSSATLSQSVVVAISPFQQEAKPFVKQLLKQLTTFESGSKITIIDGYHLQAITRFTIPEGHLKTKAIIKRNRKSIGALMRFAGKDSKATPENYNAVRLPQLLRYIAENHAFEDVIILGSPLYNDPQEPNLSMAGGYIPSDGHINASRASSVYGTAESLELLNAMLVHLGFEENDKILSDQHRFFLQRFWTLWIENQGGKLVSFSNDIESVFNRVKNQVRPLNHSFALEPSTKLEMIRFRHEKPSLSIYDRELSNYPLSQRDTKRAVNVEIGIQWDCKSCDLDLYARGRTHADILYFGRKETVMGNHWKDFTSSPSLTNAYETISFKVPLALEQLRLGINFYGGRVPKSIKGSIRLSVSGLTYEKPFVITANSGNSGKGMEASFQTGIAANLHILMFEALKITQPFKK